MREQPGPPEEEQLSEGLPSREAAWGGGVPLKGSGRWVPGDGVTGPRRQGTRLPEELMELASQIREKDNLFSKLSWEDGVSN